MKQKLANPIIPKKTEFTSNSNFFFTQNFSKKKRNKKQFASN